MERCEVELQKSQQTRPMLIRHLTPGTRPGDEGALEVGGNVNGTVDYMMLHKRVDN
jgi:hypothetical protein